MFIIYPGSDLFTKIPIFMKKFDIPKRRRIAFFAMIIQLYILGAYGIESYLIIYVYSLKVSLFDLYLIYGFTLLGGVLLIMLWFVNESRIMKKNANTKGEVV